MAYRFTRDQKRMLMAYRESTVQDEKSTWQTDQEMENVALKKRVTHKGVTFKLYLAEKEPSDIWKAKVEATKSAIEYFQDAGIMFSNGDVEEFRVVCYGGNGNSGKKMSRGVVWFDNPGRPKPTVLLQLGSRVVCHYVPQMQQDGIVYGVGFPAPSIVADRIYDYYKGTHTVSAKKRCALVQVFHEFGHIFHQLQAPEAFKIGADVFLGRDNENVTWSRRHTRFEQELDDANRLGKKYVSHYAGKKQINEYVAETFSAIMMGVPWDQVNGHIMRIYRAFDGPVPPRPRTIKRLNSFKNQTCNCSNKKQVVSWGPKWGEN